MKSPFAILPAACAFLLTTLGTAIAQDRGGRTRTPVQAEADSTDSEPPGDELSLARYFRELASQEYALADSYRHTAAVYKDTTMPRGLDLSSARDLRNQYSRLAEIETRAAQATDDRAEYLSRLAEATRNIGSKAVRRNPSFSSFGK
jgi:hypothetical protein